MNSISENFTEAMKSTSSKNEFLQQFDLIVKGVEESLKKQRNIMNQKAAIVDDLKSTHQSVSVINHHLLSLCLMSELMLL